MYICVDERVCVAISEKREYFSLAIFRFIRYSVNRSVYIEIIFLVQKTISHTIVVSRHLGSFFKLKKTSVVQFQNKRLSNILCLSFAFH